MEYKIETTRHSLSHVLAAAVLEMFPEAKLGIGPAVENGFYYDFELPRTLIPEDLPLIEEKMRVILRDGLQFEKVEISVLDALSKLKKSKQIYKCELVEDLKKEEKKTVSLYSTGSFIDLCAGPHVKSTDDLLSSGWRLDKIAGAYWKGDEKNKMLQRIYGLAFENQRELDDYLKTREEAEKRDHRKLGEELDLFLISSEVGAGLPIWLPKGATLRALIKDYLTQKLLKADYKMVETPHIALSELWKISGHLGFYRENMYSPFKVEKQEFLVKPMNCPFHIQAYKHRLRSYKDLPIKFAEFGTVYRYEKSGVLHGLMRVRGFTQDDAHIFCREDQVEPEIKKAVSFALDVLKRFGFGKYDIYLSTKPDKAVGSEKHWRLATSALKKALEEENLNYQIDEGEGVFYGPKIDIKIKDSLGRSWQCTTVQVDFNLPEAFDLEYIDEDGKKKRTIMIHRALLGSLERFIGILIEHYAGAFPAWIAPVQVAVLPISDKFLGNANDILFKLEKEGIRAEVNRQNESIGRKIKETQIQKIPYMLIVGQKEAENNNVSVRSLHEGDLGPSDLVKFIRRVKNESKD